MALVKSLGRICYVVLSRAVSYNSFTILPDAMRSKPKGKLKEGRKKSLTSERECSVRRMGNQWRKKGPSGWGKEANRMKMRRKKKERKEKELKVDVKDKR